VSEDSRKPTKGEPAAWRVGGGLITSRHKNEHVTKCYTGRQIWRALMNTVTNLWVP
jgi:hypothetical protein